MKKTAFALTLALSAATAFAASTHDRASRPQLDRFLDRGIDAESLRANQVQMLDRRERRTESRHNLAGFRSSFDVKLGAPTFLWADGSVARPAFGALPMRQRAESFGRYYLGAQAGVLGIDRRMVSEARVGEARETRQGSLIARFQQRVDGLEVFNRQINVLMDRDGNLVATSGNFHGPRSQKGSFSLNASDVIAHAVGDLGGHLSAGQLTSFKRAGDYEWFASRTANSDYTLLRAARAKRVLYPTSDGLEPAYYLEVIGRPTSSKREDAYGYVISANDGSVLFRNNLVAYEGGTTAFTYRVWADPETKQPYDSPLGNGYVPFAGTGPADVPPRVGAPSNLVTLVSAPFSKGDAWLPDGATTTTGNHADAYLDSGVQADPGLYIPILPFDWPGDGYVAGTGDLRSATTAANTFGYKVDSDADPSGADAKQVAIVNLFYMNNWLHDWWYDHGFDEVAGNAQTDNYGRGGSAGDPVQAQGQDSSGRNNANMLTPADGSSPRMQMYLFDGPVRGEVCLRDPQGNCPSDNAGTGFKFAGASFGPQTFDVEGSVVVGNDRSAPTSNGCNDLVQIPDPTGLGLIPAVPSVPDPNLFGNIALIDRGECNFTTKAQFAMLSGATGLIVVNNGDGDPSTMGNADIPIDVGVGTDQLYTVPSVMITKADGELLKTLIAAGDTSVHMKREAAIDFDGTLDNLVIAHEYFHYVSNRLIGDGSGLSNNQGGSMGEGWGDIDAWMMSVRPEDALVPGNEEFHGAYPSGFYVLNTFYYGIRRMPYSYDFTKNSLTFKHITDGVALDPQAPVGFGADGSTNSEVHNAGEVWANTVFNAYVNLLNTPGLSFADAQSRMKDYIICGMKMTPSSPTYTEARDGILACAEAVSVSDFNALARGFARRGMGIDAVSPARDSTDHAGVVESYVAIEASAPTIAAGLIGDGSDFTLDACDQDGVFDAGDIGLLTFELVNNGGYAEGQEITGTLTTTTPGFTISGSGKLTFTAGAIGETATASIKATLDASASDVSSLSLTLAIDEPAEPDEAVRYPTSAQFTLPANTDIAQNSTTDDFEHADISASQWSVSSSGSTDTWVIEDHDAETESGLGWFAPDIASASQFVLTSPAFTVDATGSFVFEFDQYYEFETDFLGEYDGGVVEISVNGGAWQDAADFGATFADGYNGSIEALDGRDGYTGDSGGVVHESINFGTSLQGKTVKLRFIVANDSAVAAYGWIIDNVKVTGAGTPFYSVTAEDGECINRPPYVNAGLDLEVEEGSNVSLAGTASDPEAAPGLALKWTQVSGPAVTLAGDTTANPTFKAPEVDEDSVLVFALTATDAGSATASDEVQVTVTDKADDPDVNDPPVANAGADFSAPEGSTVHLNGSASDPESGALMLTWLQLSGPEVTLSSATSSSPSFVAPEVATPTTLVFRLTATDSGGLSGSDDVSVTITNLSSGFAVSAGGDFTTTEYASVRLNGSVSVADGQSSPSLLWTQVSGPAVTLAGATTISPSFVAPEVGSNTVFVFRLTATADGQSVSDLVQVTVRNINTPPVADAGVDREGVEGQAISVAGSGTDADGDTLTYSWSQVSGPSTSLSTGAGPTVTFTPTTQGSYVLRLTVTDSSGTADSDEVTVTIGPNDNGSGGGGGGSLDWLLIGGLAGLAAVRRRLQAKR